MQVQKISNNNITNHTSKKNNRNPSFGLNLRYSEEDAVKITHSGELTLMMVDLLKRTKWLKPDNCEVYVKVSENASGHRLNFSRGAISDDLQVDNVANRGLDAINEDFFRPGREIIEKFTKIFQPKH